MHELVGKIFIPRLNSDKFRKMKFYNRIIFPSTISKYIVFGIPRETKTIFFKQTNTFK